MASSDCFFKCDKDADLITGGKERINKVISSSIARNDTYHVQLQNQLDNDPDITISFHKSCISTYTSTLHIKRHLKRVSSNQSLSDSPPSKLRSDHREFNFRQHCLICGENCIPKDKKNPGRWRQVISCRTVEKKQDLLEICDKRGDELAAEVRVRIHGATTDLHAADAQYHYDCYITFTGKRNVAAAAVATGMSGKQEIDPSDLALKNVVDTLQKDPQKIWNSVEVYDVYCRFLNLAKDASTHSPSSDPQEIHSNAIPTDIIRKDRALLIQKLENVFGDSLIVLRVKGCASIICFRKHLPVTLKLVEANDNDEVSELANKITSEVKSKTEKNVDTYDLGDFKFDKVEAACSTNLLYFISSLVSKGAITKKSLCLTQSIQALITSGYNQTTLGLAVKLHHRFGSRELIDLLHSHGYVSSYDEVQRYRKSAAKMTAEQDFTFRGLMNDGGLVSSWCDNFDLQVYTPNGCRETHAMAVEFTQHAKETQDQPSTGIVIPRISKQEVNSMKASEMSSVNKFHFHGPKKPEPPEVTCNVGQPFDHVSKTAATVRSALDSDMQWMVAVIESTDGASPEPEWSGAMVKAARIRGDVPRAATQFVFGPLIDSPPAHPDTVLTTLIFIEEFMKQHNMPYIHLSADMQLYKVIMQIKWSNINRWTRLVVRPGGMHTLMSFIGCIGTLMNGSGIEELLGVAFKGVSHMLRGKAWPKAVRGLRMVVCALLEPLITSGKTTMVAIEEELEKGRQSRTGRLWIDCLITPVAIIHMFLRAEREGDWLLHMYALKRMVPYFFAANHFNYARYVSWHILDMTAKLPDAILEAFLHGEHVCRHRDGLWNSVFLDQFGEQTYIRYGKSKGGLVGKSLSSNQVSEWVLSHHLCNTLSLLMDTVYEESTTDHNMTNSAHKEEADSRKRLDASDRNKIREELKKHTNPIFAEPEDRLSNIINGRIAPEEVNVDNALVIGRDMAYKFMVNLPKGFHTPIKKEVVTMEKLKKRTKVGEASIYDPEKLYARLLVISQNRNIPLSEVFKHELSPVPSALFDEYGDMRKGSKAVLVQKLAVFATTPLAQVDLELIDGNEAIYHTSWQRNTMLKDFADDFLKSFDRSHDTYIVFDRYDKHSIKSHERLRRAKGAISLDYVLNSNTILPAKEVIMKSDKNKTALIQYLCDADKSNPCLQLIGDDSDYRHEEADVKLISYLLEMIPQRKHVQVLADDTDIFVLLVYFVWHYKLQAQVSMRKYNGKVIDISATASKLGDKSCDLLALHALSGCDTVSYPYGKGKKTAINLMDKKDLRLKIFTEEAAEEEEWMKAAMNFLSYLYCGEAVESLSDLRYTLFTRKRNPPKIKSLPPTKESAAEHIKRARLQVLIWRAADKIAPPESTRNLSLFGWKIEEDTPVPVYGCADIAPKAVFQLVACGCKSSSPCSRATCSCRSDGLPCTTYCRCRGGEECANENSKQDELTAETDEETDEDESVPPEE